MTTLAVVGTMYYCPKCKSNFEDRTQRFCPNDGGRLLPVQPEKRSAAPTNKNVFTNLLGRTEKKERADENLAQHPRFVSAAKKRLSFEPPKKSAIFKAGQITDGVRSKPLAKPNKPESTKKPTTPRRRTKLVSSSEISVSQARLGNREKHPAGRPALTWQNPRVLLGQVIKGRYRIADKLHQDQTSIAYLAGDEIVKGKRVVIRVLMSEAKKDTFEGKVFAEERVSLSHINHPNIVRVVDSGQLPEGNTFVVTDYVEGKSVSDVLKSSGRFEAKRAARIIRHASLALSEIHQNGILHRNPKPEHILLFISDAGNEQVKVTDFSVSDGKPRIDNLAYKSPEQLAGQTPTFASDAYSLAVIGFQMLTGSLPFNDLSERELLKAQKAGLKVKASELVPEIPTLVDQIFAKALSFNPADRYSKARDFGEALFNALTTALVYDKSFESDNVNESTYQLPVKTPRETKEMPVEHTSDTAAAQERPPKRTPVTADIHISTKAANVFDGMRKSNKKDLAGQKVPRFDESKNNRPSNIGVENTAPSTLVSVLGLAAIAALAILIFVYFFNRQDALTTAPDLEQPEPRSAAIQENVEDTIDDIESPPPARKIIPPANSIYFENSKDNLNNDLKKNFRGFSVYYPKTWERSRSENNFLDISRKDKDGIPKEMMVVTHYDSNGTFKTDESNFPILIEKSNRDLSALLPNYEVVSRGKTEINNGWKGYQVKFQGKSKLADGRTLEVWGRRIWVPAARPGVKHGLVITMLATSLADKIKNLDDVGNKGDLGGILKTFEPDQNYD